MKPVFVDQYSYYVYMYISLLYCTHIHVGHMRYGRVDAPVPSKSTSAPLTSSLSKKGPVYPSSRLSITSSASSSYTHHTHTTNNNNNNTNSAYTPIPPECFASRLPVPLPPYPDDVPTPGIYMYVCKCSACVYALRMYICIQAAVDIPTALCI